MSLPGRRIHRARDVHGWVEVWRDATRLYLSFDGDTMQSALDESQPARLMFDYTRAMLLGLLFTDAPRRALLLGLGGGALATALYHACLSLRIDAVELRPLVVDIARAHFQLPDDGRLRVHVADADTFVAARAQFADILFVDLYRPEGMDEAQAGALFLAACRRALKPGGVLVLNYWCSHRLTSLALNQTLGEVFARDFLTLDVQGGNCLVFALDGGVTRITRARLIERARRLGRCFDVPLAGLARDLYRQNHARFRYAGL